MPSTTHRTETANNSEAEKGRLKTILQQILLRIRRLLLAPLLMLLEAAIPFRVAAVSGPFVVRKSGPRQSLQLT